MLLRQMKYFLAVADCKSFSEAAEQCYISQSAISQQMKVLEDELGAELIKRSNRRFQLTDIGEYLYGRSKAIVKEIDDLKVQIRKMQSTQNKQFRIGCRNGYLVKRLCLAMNSFLLDNPDVNIEVIYGDHDELMAMLHRGDVDMVLNDLRHENESASFGNIFVEQIEGMIAVSNRSPLAEKDIVDVEDLSLYTCVLLASEKHQEKEKTFFRMIFHTEKNIAIAKDLPSAVTMIVNNAGFMPVVGAMDAQEFVGNVTKLLPVHRAGEPIYIKYHAFYNKGQINDDTLRIVKNIVELLQ
ncbi:MAG: LysR family transcriptional regulator [Phascolarctobacterium sp.]